MNHAPRCRALGCENVFNYLDDVVMPLSCNSHFACYDCVNKQCEVCICDACGETLDTFPIHYGCGCAYHGTHIPPGSGAGRCAWCKRADECQTDPFDAPYVEQEEVHETPGFLSKVVGLLLSWRRKRAPEPEIAPMTKPRLTMSKMLRRGWTAETLLGLHHYRGNVIHNAGIPWNMLPELGFTMEMFNRLRVDVVPLLRRYIYYMTENDMDEFVRVNVHLSLVTVAEAIRYLIAMLKLANTNANFISNLRHRVSEKTLILLSSQGSHGLEAIMEDRKLWLHSYPNAAKKLLPQLKVYDEEPAQPLEERNKMQ